jgi:Flp pilus assembly protein TadD
MRSYSSLVCLTAFAFGCTAATECVGASKFTAEELLAGTALGVEQDSPGLIDDEEVLAVSEEMRSFLGASVDRKGSKFVRLHQLILAIINKGTFGLEYDENTRTASETFRLRKGNCLSFSTMFVALARAVGLEALYQEVDIPPDWTYRDDVFILNRHVNVLIDLGVEGEKVVDFNIDDFKTSYDRRTIPDQRAFAHYYNNLGVERMQAGDAAASLSYFRKALAENDLQFSPAWANLGILYMRHGHSAHAEAAFLQALKVNPEDYVAMSNLASLYESQGDLERASAMEKKVQRHRKQNPYYRFHLARDAFLDGDYDTAISHLKFAVRKRKQEDRFYFLMGLSYLQKGNEGAAKRWLARAEKVAATDTLRRGYSAKVEMLLSESN